MLNNTLNDWLDLREGVKSICKKFPEDYWRKIDRDREYPKNFVNSLTKNGYLACLIPEKYGGSGLNIRAAAVILEEIHRSGGNGAACHAQMYIMGSLLKHGSEKLKENYLYDIAKGKLRLQAFGVTEPTSGTDTLSIKTTALKKGNNYIINGQKVWTSRAEYSDLILLLTKTSKTEKNKRKALSLFLIDMRPHLNKEITIKPIRTMINHSTT